jgi:NAD(P)-dependent dehydrogenase (short-subunit alcohol dehydrogenase family)
MTNQQASIDGKICLVTGATSGIGKVTAQVLACEGARVVIGGRNQEKCEAAVQEIKRQSGNQKVEYILADLSCLQDVQHMAQTFLSRHQRLDVLINNAGIALFKKQTSVDGHELTFATNYLGPFLLTNLLLEVLKVSAPARIVTVSSLAHAWAQFNIDDPQKQGGVQGCDCYRPQSWFRGNEYWTWQRLALEDYLPIVELLQSCCNPRGGGSNDTLSGNIIGS